MKESVIDRKETEGKYKKEWKKKKQVNYENGNKINKVVGGKGKKWEKEKEEANEDRGKERIIQKRKDKDCLTEMILMGKTAKKGITKKEKRIRKENRSKEKYFNCE